MRLFERVSPDSAVIAILVAVTICVRLVSFVYLSSLAGANPEASPYPLVAGDSSYYANWADALLTRHAYEDQDGAPLRVQPPGYPALLAGIKAVTGSVAPVVILQILLAAFAAVLIWRMARTLVPLPYALVPAFLYAVDPMVVFTDSAVMSDGLFSSLLVCIVYLVFFSHVKSVVRWGSAGLLLGIAIMIRPIAQFLIIVFPALYLLRSRFFGATEEVSRVKSISVFLVVCALILTPWMARNQRTFGSFEISVLGPHNLLYNDVRGFLAWRALEEASTPMPAILVMRRVSNPVFAAVDGTIAKGLAEITPQGENVANYEGRLAISYILHDPIRYTYFHAVNTIPFFLSSSVASYGQIVRQLRDNEGFFAPVTLSILDSLGRIRHPENARSFIDAVQKLAPIGLEMFWWLIVTLAAIAAAVLRRKDFTIILCAVLVLYFAALTGPMSNSRYRIPAEPYLLILAVAGAHAILNRGKEKVI